MIKAELTTTIGSSLLAYFTEDDAPRIVASIRDSHSGIRRVSATLLASDATWLTVNAAMRSLGDFGTQSVIIVIADMTEWDRAIRTQRMLIACNIILVRAVDETPMLADICQSIIDANGYQFVWIGYAEHDEAKSVRPMAQAGDGADLVRNAKISWADNERGRGPAGKAIRTGRTIVTGNAEMQPDHQPWRHTAREKGYGHPPPFRCVPTTKYSAF